MKQLPMLKAQSLKGDSIDFTKEKTCLLILSFDKLHYTEGLNWYYKLQEKTSLPIYKIPVLSDRFTLMQDILFDGIKVFFSKIEENTFPAFVNRINFFDETNFDETNPIIVRLHSNGEYETFKSPDEYTDS